MNNCAQVIKVGKLNTNNLFKSNQQQDQQVNIKRKGKNIYVFLHSTSLKEKDEHRKDFSQKI